MTGYDPDRIHPFLLGYSPRPFKFPRCGLAGTAVGRDQQLLVGDVYKRQENGTKPTVLPEQALVVTEVLEAIYTSAKTGKPVFFD